MDKKTKQFILLTLLVIATSTFIDYGSMLFSAQEMQGSTERQTVVFAPSGLTNKEQTDLERNYKFQYRDKSRVLSSYTSTGIDMGPDVIESREINKEEKLYRYFGAAMGLYKEGRLDEAIEVLKYIACEKPEDDYVKNCLKEMLIEKEAVSKKWGSESIKQARALKGPKIRNLLQEGIDYYKRKDYEMALLKFHDVLTMDQNNVDARTYMGKIKEHYAIENRVENLVENYRLDKNESPHVVYTQNDIVKKILDEQESKINTAIERILNSQDNKQGVDVEPIIKAKRIDSLLNQAELKFEIDEIIKQKKIEEIRSKMYTLGAGDIIQISVRDHPELSGKAIVRLNGEVVLPLVNDVIRIKGLTLEEATEIVVNAIKRYVKDPFITLTIEEYKSKTFYVIDETGCTPYPITRANITLRDALFIADWGDNRALGRVIVMKPDKIHPTVKKVDAFDIMYRGNLADNVRIEDGDVIYAPLTIAAKVSQTIVDALRPFAAVRQARNEWINYKADEKTYKDIPRVHTNRDQTTAWDGQSFPSSLLTVQ